MSTALEQALDEVIAGWVERPRDPIADLDESMANLYRQLPTVTLVEDFTLAQWSVVEAPEESPALRREDREDYLAIRLVMQERGLIA